MDLRRAQSLDGDSYHRPAMEHAPEWHVPYDSDDRNYMILMYQEHAKLARQQEYLRAFWSAVLMCLGVLLLLTARDQSRQGLSGGILAAAGILGGFALAKHYARYKLHVSVMRSFRLALAETVRSDISRLSTTVRLRHDQDNRWVGAISLHSVFLLLALAMVGGGAELIWRSVDDGALLAAEPIVNAGAAPAGEVAITRAPATVHP